MNGVIARQSSPTVVSREVACHAGGRGFESRRSRKVPANRHSVLSGLTPDRGRLHRLFSKRRRNRQKRPGMRSRGHDFKPIQAHREGGVRLHKMAGGQGPAVCVKWEEGLPAACLARAHARTRDDRRPQTLRGAPFTRRPMPQPGEAEPRAWRDVGISPHRPTSVRNRSPSMARCPCRARVTRT